MFSRFQITWADLPLRLKISALMSLLVTGAVLGLTFISIERERANFRQELVEQADLFLKTSAQALRDSLYLLELDELTDVARAARDNPDVTVFTVFDSKARILVDSTDLNKRFSQEIDPLGEILLAQNPEDLYLEWQSDQLVAGQVVVLGNQRIGALATGLSTVPLDRKINDITWQGVLLASITLLLGGVLTYVLSRQITLPLTELTRVASAMSEGDLSVRVEQKSGDEIGRLGVAFNEMAAGLQEREWLRDMFGRFVSSEVAEAMRTGKVRLEGENRVVSVLFCDIREFTDFSERHTPQEVVAMLNNFLPLVVQAAQRNNGMVNKFGGDSTLIVYGAPNDLKDSAYHAVLTALDIRAGLQKLNANLTKNGEPPLRVGAGINTGVALAGAIGPHERQEYTVVGNTVNLAARIDGLNKQFPEHDILISNWTYEALGSHRDEFVLLSLGEVSVRGRFEPIQIWSVVSRKHEPTVRNRDRR